MYNYIYCLPGLPPPRVGPPARAAARASRRIVQRHGPGSRAHPSVSRKQSLKVLCSS